MSFLKIGRGQRVGQPDFQFAVFDSIRDAVNNALDKVVIGKRFSNTTIQKDVIIAGFIISESSGAITVSGGAALLGYVDRGVVQRSALVYDLTSRTVDISAFDDDTYTVWVRAAYRDSNYAARPHWNPLASPNPIEYVRNVATRMTSTWDLKIELTSPGDEWMAIGTVDKNTGVYTIVDMRRFLFEGRPDASTPWKLDNNDWGTTNDRSASRATYGIAGFHVFAKMLMRQVQDIIGGDSHVANPQAGSATLGTGARSLTQLNDEKLARTGGTDSPMVGNLIPGTTNTYDIGSTARRWVNGWFNYISLLDFGSSPTKNRLYSNNLPKAWCTLSNATVFGGGIASGSISLIDGFGISAVSFVTPPDGLDGQFKVTFTNAFANNTYACFATCAPLLGTGQIARYVRPVDATTTYWCGRFTDVDDNVMPLNANAGLIHLVFFGTQA